MRLSDELEREAENVAQEVVSMVDSWAAREARPVVKGVCIDGDKSLDRDDAIWFEEKDGKLVVDITIADVAAFVSKGSALDKNAFEVTESTYKSPAQVRRSKYQESNIDVPMLPFKLSEDNSVEGNGVLSLSNKPLKTKEGEVNYRAGMTKRIVIDPKEGRVESVEMFPSLIHPEVINYRKIADEIDSEPNGRFAQWAGYTALLKRLRRKGSEGVLPMNMTDELNDKVMVISEEIEIKELAAREITASKMVEETALLANDTGANFYAACNIPYLFRVHKVKLEGDDTDRAYSSINEAADAKRALEKTSPQRLKMILDRARYSPYRERHAALGKYAYSHDTSPIRRATDLVCQRMDHWVHETIAEISHQLDENVEGIDMNSVAHYIGALRQQPEREEPHNGAKVMQWLYQLRVTAREKPRELCYKNLQKYMSGMIHDLNPQISLDKCYSLSSAICGKLAQSVNTPPYTQAEMQSIARGINVRQSKRTMTRREKMARELVLTQIERELEMAEIQVLTALELDDHVRREEEISKFSSAKRLPLTLHLAAQERLEYRVPAAEILRRMQDDRLREPSDLATLLVEMKIPTLEDAADDPAFADEKSQDWLKQNIEDWHQLKETVLARFAANPSFTKGFFKHLEERYHWKIHSTHASLIAEGAIAATMSLNPSPHLPPEQAAEQTLFPPSFSIGHWGKTTRHHARLELLRGLAYDTLLPAQKVKLPRALRLMTAAGLNELISPDSKTLDLLKEKAEKAHIHIEKHWDKTNKTYSLLASTEGEGRDPIEFIGEGDNKKTARAMAWQAMMRSKIMRPVHEELFRKREKLKAIPINADEAIEWMSDQNGYVGQDLHLSMTNQYTQRREPIWQARLTLQMNSAANTRQFIGESTQADVAKTFANEAGLRYLRERADYGDKAIETALKNYEEEVAQRYKQEKVFSSKVPYTAQMNGRDIIPTDHSPQRVNGRG